MSYVDIIKGITYEQIKGNIEQEFTGKIRIDSRIVRSGDIFVAIKGENVDGHDFIDQAIKSGVSCIIIEKDIEVNNDIIIVKVIDTKKCLLELANVIRKKYINIPLIAVTGSVGKTTTKELIYSFLSTKYKVLKNEGNKNNALGLPLTLFELDDTYDMVVLELGMNHLGEIDILSRTCLPSDGVITNIGTSHIGNLGSKKNIFLAKLEILNGLNNGTLFINGDDKYLKKIKKENFFLVKCGLKRSNDIRAIDIICTDKNLYFKIKKLDNYYNALFPIPNISLVSNILLACAVALKYGVPITKITESLENYRSLDCRNQIIQLNNNITLIDDSYNASLESLKSGLMMIDNFDKKKIIVLGDILELGDFSNNIHKQITPLLKKYEKAILVGEHVKNIIGNNCIHCALVDDAIKYLETIDLTNYLIYIKGSHNINLNKLSNELKQKFLK